MKIYEIYDREAGSLTGALLYYEKAETFVIELSENLDEWRAPLLLAGLVKKGIYTVPRQLSAVWVAERIIPNTRQNVKSILAQHKLKSYDELKFLEISRGECAQDALYLKPVKELPDYVCKRMQKNITECVVCEDDSLLLFFQNGEIKKVDLSSIPDTEKILANRKLLDSASVSAGGFSVTFLDSIDISRDILYEKGELVPLKQSDFLGFIEKNTLDTTQCCNLLQCSRQNLTYRIKQEQLKPVRENLKGNLFLKGDVLKNSW